LEFRNRKKAKYDWDNEEIEEHEDLMESPDTAAHPDILAEIPGVELEADHEECATAVEAVPKPDLAARAAAARTNANLAQSPGVPVRKIAGVIKAKKTAIIVVDDDSSDGEDGYDTDDAEAGMQKMTKTEYDSSDSEDDDDKVMSFSRNSRKKKLRLMQPLTWPHKFNLSIEVIVRRRREPTTYLAHQSLPTRM